MLKYAAVLMSLSLAPTVAANPSSRSQGPAKARKVKIDAKAKAKKPKNYDFLADDVVGEGISPDQSDVLALVGRQRTSLIRVRLSFVPEILKAAENL